MKIQRAAPKVDVAAYRFSTVLLTEGSLFLRTQYATAGLHKSWVDTWRLDGHRGELTFAQDQDEPCQSEELLPILQELDGHIEVTVTTVGVDGHIEVKSDHCLGAGHFEMNQIDHFTGVGGWNEPGELDANVEVDHCTGFG